MKNTQNAGAIGVEIVTSSVDSPPPGMGGVDPTITAPSAQITQADGAILQEVLRFCSHTRSGVIARLFVNLALRSGTNPVGRVLQFTPNPFQPDLSVSR